jgi:hypothetical protein
MKKLIPMTDFVLERSKQSIIDLTFEESIKKTIKIVKEIFEYAKFLKQPLKLEMFVPCDEDGNVLEMPVNYDVWLELHNKNVDGEKGTIGFLLHEEYQKAKEKVIFEGFELCPNNGNVLKKGNILINISNLETIEDLIPYNLEVKNEILLF